jgi:DNA repair protein RecO (recombination protein O)
VEDLTTRAFCLRTRAYGESDVIAVLLTEDHGKVSGMARGAKRSKQRFAGGALQPFHELVLRFARRPHTDLAFLHECRVVHSHHAIAEHIDAYAWASYVSELADVTVPERDPSPQVFGLFERTMHALATRPEDPEPTAHHFIMSLLDHAGWGLDLNRCAVCDEEIADRLKPILDPRGSGLICSRHVAERLGVDPLDPDFSPGRRVVDTALLDYVRQARAGVPRSEDAALRATASALLDRLLDLHVDRPLKSRAFLGRIRAEARTGSG